jgi:ABC-type iron transport system FetAB permease component
MSLFFIGVLEMLIVTIWTKVVSETRVLASGIVTMVNVLIWYYVLQRILDDMGNWWLVLLYASGCSLGTILSTYAFQLRDNFQSAKVEAVMSEQN